MMWPCHICRRHVVILICTKALPTLLVVLDRVAAQQNTIHAQSLSTLSHSHPCVPAPSLLTAAKECSVSPKRSDFGISNSAPWHCTGSLFSYHKPSSGMENGLDPPVMLGFNGQYLNTIGHFMPSYIHEFYKSHTSIQAAVYSCPYTL